MLLDEIEHSRGAEILDSFREVRTEQQCEIDETIAVELQRFVHVCARDRDERLLVVRQAPQEGRSMEEHILDYKAVSSKSSMN